MATADLHTATTFAAPPVAWITRQLNDARHAIFGSEARPATELCGELAEFMGILGEDEDWDGEV